LKTSTTFLKIALFSLLALAAMPAFADGDAAGDAGDATSETKSAIGQKENYENCTSKNTSESKGAFFASGILTNTPGATPSSAPAN